MKGKIHGFPPVIGESPGILILGSMPGVRSLESGRYYDHPRNHFWKIIFSLLGRPHIEEYELKIAALQNAGIALWDVIARCRREGSLDQDIQDQEYNDVAGLILENPGIELICFNGGTAEREFWKGIKLLESTSSATGTRWMRAHQIRTGASRRFVRLPSSSPVPTRNYKTWEDKLTDWRVISEYIDGDRR